MKIRRPVHCLLCQVTCRATSNPNRYKHPKAEDCLVTVVDRWGICADDVVEPEKPKQPPPFEVEGLVMFPHVEDVLPEIFAAAGVPRLGGQSTGRGWSSVSTFQKCRYLWKRKYLDQVRDAGIGSERPARAMGTLIHTFLAIYYTRMIEPDYPLTPEMVRDQLKLKANPILVDEGYRFFVGYALFYQNEEIMPLAVEYNLVDPRTGDSCRFDLIAFFPNEAPGRPAGTYEIEHKSSQRFDYATKNGWPNDGEVIGQLRLWKDLGLDKRFGSLQGAMINLIGTQKVEQQFHRSIVPLLDWQISGHRQDLKLWESDIHTSIATGIFPRSRASCVHRYGMCDLFDECAVGETTDGSPINVDVEE